jgi:Mn-dependent DtxR family transcriptional regulator
MAEDIKERIYNFLISNSNQTFNVKQIAEALEISYPTALKWISVLEAEGKIDVTDYGNIKLVKVKK